MSMKRIFLFVISLFAGYLIITFLTGCNTMKKTYVKERKELLEQNKNSEVRVFTEELVKDLPEQIKKYLSVCGYMNTAVPINANVYYSETQIKLSP